MILRIKWPILAFVLSLFCPLSSFAMHIIGGEITYEYVEAVGAGQSRYKFTLKVYRDCNGGGAPFDASAFISIYRGNINSSSRIGTIQVGPPSISKIQPVPPDCISQIPNVCVEQGVYTFERVLANSETDSYFIVYQRCCRNVTITNLFNPEDIGATYMIEITPEAQRLKNDSPVFKNFPPIIICNNFPLDFDHSAVDAEGDLLVYSFCSPFAGGGPILQQPAVNSCTGAVPTASCPPPYENVPFAVPNYSPENPMGGQPRVVIDPTTGRISGQPNMLGQFVVGVCVQEFRDGKLLSTLKRDFQFNVADCKPTVIADVKEDTVKGPKEYFINSCGRNTVKFLNESQIRANISNFEWRFNLKGQTFSDKQNWDASVTFPDTGIYKGMLILNPGQVCGDTGYITVSIFPKVEANFSYSYDTCVASPVVFKDASTGEAGIVGYNWSFGVPGGSSKLQNPNYQYAIPGAHPARLTVTDKNNCKDDTTQIVRYFPAPPLIIIQPSAFVGCAPASIFFNNLSKPIDSTYKILWKFGDGTEARNVISPTHLYEKEGVFDIEIEITSPIGCFIKDRFEDLIRVLPSPNADFSYSPDSALSNLNNFVRFTNLSTGANRWNWMFGKLGMSSLQNPEFTFPDTGMIPVKLVVTHPSGCQDTITKILDIKPEVRWFMPNAFTPNGDSVNDGFFGKGILDGAADFRMSIWNRWGEMVFETADPEQAWTGETKSRSQAPAGVYVYVVTFKGPRGENFEYKGFATLIR
jgi:gliding motility-associated-like protein